MHFLETCNLHQLLLGASFGGGEFLIEHISLFQFYKKLNLRIFFFKSLIVSRGIADELICRTDSCILAL